jgi:multiple sugar transport system permease protein
VGNDNPLPWIALLLIFIGSYYVTPALDVIRFAFTDSSLLRDDYSYTLDTLRRAASSSIVHHSLRVTLIYVSASVVLQLALGLMAALAVHRGSSRNLPGTNVVRSVVLTSWVMPGVVVGVVWKLVLSEASYGLVNSAVMASGSAPIPFLSNSAFAVWMLIVVSVWRGTAFTMILLYARMHSIPVELYEAAKVDGASAVRMFRHVTLPQLKGVIAISLILTTIAYMNRVDLVIPLTGGGPGRATEVLALLTYNSLFVNFNLGTASALGTLMLVLSLTFTLLYRRVLREEAT